MPLGIISDENLKEELEKLGIEITEVKEGSNQESDTDDSVQIEQKSKLDVSEENPISARIAQVFKPTGRGKGSTEVPQGIRKLIGENSIEEGTASSQAIANFLGISKSSVSAYSKGSTSTKSYNEPEADLLAHLTKKKTKIAHRASSKLIKSLNKLDDDKLDALDGKELASVAKDMSAIVKNMETQEKSVNINAPVITFYNPGFVKEDKFDVIEVSE